MLAIPSLAGVPRAYTIPGDAAGTAAVVAALLDAGLISPRTTGRTPAEVLRAGLAQWLDRQLAGCRRIRVGVEYYEARAVHHYTGVETAHATLLLRCVGVPHVFIGRALERLSEPAARRVLAALYSAGTYGFPLLTPPHVLGFAEFCHWQGASDEREVVAEYTAQGETYDGPTRVQWNAYLPAWALEPGRAKRRTRAQSLQGETAPRMPFALASALERVDTAIAAAKRASLARPEHYDEIEVAFCLWLRWKREPGKDAEALIDARIVDDYFEDAAQSCGVSDTYAEAEIRAPEDVATQLAAWEPFFALARAVEALLTAAGVRDDA